MRRNILIPLLVLLGLPCLKSYPQEITPLKMINFSPYTKGDQNPDNGTLIPEAQIIELLDIIKPYTEGIRTFGTLDGLERIPKLAKARDLKVYLGIWLSADTAVNTLQITSGINIAKQGYADKIIVGSEVLLRNELTPERIIEYITKVKNACPGIPVSYADITSKLIENPSIIEICDFISVNNYPFWEGVPVECALKSFHQSYLSLLSVANGKTIFISESGWKTEGPPVGEAVPSIVNSARYLRELLNWSKATGVEVGIFSAFDEPWKITKNDYGWGVFTPEGSLKIGLEEIFDPIVNIETTWLCNKINIATTDTLNIDYLPPIGNTDELLSGRVNFINSCDVRISAYIKVSNGWWTKPTFTEPSVPVLCNGRFNLRFVTGGMDYSATDIYIFLIPADYTPPTCGGCTTLPLEVFANAIARKLITRCPLPFDDITANPSSVCEGSTSTLSVSGGVSYLWNSGEATPAITVHPKLTTSYSVMVTRASGCIETRSTQILFKAKPFIWLGEDRTTDTYGNVILDAGAYNPAPSSLTYLWSTGATTRQINVHYDNPGNYPFRAEITDAQGCTNSDTVLVTVLLATGVRENNSKGNILCYPNPVRNGTISFRSDGQPLPEKSTLLIIDNQGRTVKRVNNIQLDQSVDIKELPSGIYNVSIYKGKPGEGFTGKISVLK